ncbi:MAG: dienelactone hydrolase family protein [Pseudomonadota bacterium]
MPITDRPIAYEHGGVALEGTLAYDDAQSGARPIVLVSHTWAGRTDFEIDVARRLAGLGYAGFALDLYGKGVTGSGPEECEKLMTPFLEDRAMLHGRLQAALAAATKEPEADAGRAAAIGYCFGGLCVLDMARIGANVKGVASFHGLFNAPAVGKIDKISAKVIAFHGYDDPLAPPSDMTGLADELTKAGADWQIHAYGATGHAFTNPQANDVAGGMFYKEIAAKRAWRALEGFLEETL